MKKIKANEKSIYRAVPSENEKSICKAIADYLAIVSATKNFVYFHVPNEYIARGIGYAWERMLRSMGKIAGAPDYVIAKNGRVMFIEVKTSKGWLTENQVKFKVRCKLAGVPYFVCRSLDDVMTVLEENNFL